MKNIFVIIGLILALFIVFGCKPNLDKVPLSDIKLEKISKDISGLTEIQLKKYKEDNNLLNKKVKWNYGTVSSVEENYNKNINAKYKIWLRHVFQQGIWSDRAVDINLYTDDESVLKINYDSKLLYEGIIYKYTLDYSMDIDLYPVRILK